jgi:hypothetical protein
MNQVLDRAVAVPGASIHWYEKPGMADFVVYVCGFTGSLLIELASTVQAKQVLGTPKLTYVFLILIKKSGGNGRWVTSLLLAERPQN